MAKACRDLIFLMVLCGGVAGCGASEDCSLGSCQNGGVCTDGSDGFTCTCGVHYFGPDCSGTCQCGNGGVCDGGANGTGECTCAPGYFGPQCDGVCACLAELCDDGADGTGSCGGGGGLPCGTTPDGGVETRTRYQAETVPEGSSCQSETQTRICNDGVWGQWSGTYVFASCSVASDPVWTCDQQTGLDYGVCHEFSGPNAESDLDNACSVGISGTGCPPGAVGLCDLSNVGANPDGYVQYHYVSGGISGAGQSQDLCDIAGGSWSAP